MGALGARQERRSDCGGQRCARDVGRHPRILAELASIHSRRGELDAVRGILTELEDRATKSFVEHTALGSVHACLGEMAEARRLVALGIEQHEIWWQFAKAPAWAPFRADAEGVECSGRTPASAGGLVAQHQRWQGPSETEHVQALPDDAGRGDAPPRLRAPPRATIPTSIAPLHARSSQAARVSETQLAERATGYLWGEPRLRAFVEEMRAEAEAVGDDRLEQVARRFLG